MEFHFPSWWWNWIERQKQQAPTETTPVPPSPSPAPRPRGIFRWLHRDRDIARLSAAALETAKFGRWNTLDKKTLVRQFRAFLVLSLRIAALTSKPVPLGQLGPHLYSNPDRNAAGSALARTVTLLAPASLRPASDIITEESQPPIGTIETGAAPVITILLITACAVAAAFLGSSISQTVRTVHFDNELTRRLLSTQARAIELMTLHIERERIAGHELPFDESEREWLLGLEDLQRHIAALMQRPLPTPFQGATEFVRAATDFLPIALLGIAAFVLLNKKPERRS